MELNIWSMLHHPNITPLIAVMMGDPCGYCYQFMPLMSGDLCSMMINCTDLLTLLKWLPHHFKLIIANVKYILAEILTGLVYLEEQNVQHCDIKGEYVCVFRASTY